MVPVSPAFRQSEALLDTVFARCAKGNKRVKVFFLVMAGLGLLGGILSSANSDENLRTPGMISSLLVFLLFGGFGFYMLIKPPEEKFEAIKVSLRDRPEELVWTYILEQRVNGFPSWFVVMNFRNKTNIHIHNRSIPNKDMEGFVQVLLSINPKMHVGYSDDLKKMYKRGEM